MKLDKLKAFSHGFQSKMIAGFPQLTCPTCTARIHKIFKVNGKNVYKCEACEKIWTEK